MGPDRPLHPVVCELDDPPLNVAVDRTERLLYLRRDDEASRFVDSFERDHGAKHRWRPLEVMILFARGDLGAAEKVIEEDRRDVAARKRTNEADILSKVIGLEGALRARGRVKEASRFKELMERWGK